MVSALRALVMLLALVGATGCRLVEQGAGARSPLLPLALAPDAIALEVFSAPVPLGDPRIVALWKQVDEQALPADLRKKLAQNGLRAGVVGSSVPAELTELLKLTDKPITAEEQSSVPLDAEEGVVLTVMQPRIGERRDLVTSETLERVSLLRRVDGQVEGKTYYKAEGRLVMRVFAEQDARVRIELTPELHHGEFKNRVTGSDGIMHLKQERQKQVFEELKLTATLAAGQMFLVTCASDLSGSVGHCFFAHSRGELPMQKLYVFRVSQASPDRSFYEGPKETGEAISSDSGP